MLLPINTDAPVYYYPFATIGLIVLNIVCFLLTGMGSDQAIEIWGPLALDHGNGLHPVQWVTSNFIHAGFGHLFGNMVFLWGFGLVVEGKLGWWKFLLVYFGIGVSQCAFEQVVTLGFDPAKAVNVDLEDMRAGLQEALVREGKTPDQIQQELADFDATIRIELDDLAQTGSKSFGASSIVFGLLAMSLVWAPKNELTLLIIAGFRVFTWEVSIMAFSAWYIGVEIVTAVMESFAIATATLHLMGAAVGFGVGVVMLKKDLVDCEDWDLFSVMSGRYGSWARDSYGNRLDEKGKIVPTKTDDAPAKTKARSNRPSAAVVKKKLAEIESLIEDGEFMDAHDALYNLRRKDRNAKLDAAPLKSLIAGLYKGKCWDEVVPLMNEFIQTYPDQATPIQLRLANYELTQLEDAEAALETLRSIDRETLSEDAKATFLNLMKKAKNQDL